MEDNNHNRLHLTQKIMFRYLSLNMHYLLIKARARAVHTENVRFSKQNNLVSRVSQLTAPMDTEMLADKYPSIISHQIKATTKSTV